MIDNISFDDYKTNYTKVQQALEKGYSYQINLAKNISGKTSLSSIALYNRLKKQKPVNYAAFLPFLEPDIISISPELFFRKNNSKLVVKPMKGTARLTGDINKEIQIERELKNCQKQ